MIDYYDQMAAFQYDEVIDDLEDEIDDLKKERENILSDVEFMEKESKVQSQSIINLKFEIDKLITENKYLREELQRLSADKFALQPSVRRKSAWALSKRA